EFIAFLTIIIPCKPGCAPPKSMRPCRISRGQQARGTRQAEEAAMPDSLSIVVEKDIPVAMRDGTILRTDVYRPAEGGPFPVIMQRTPYNKETAALSLQQTDVFRAVRRGYAVVNQDVRGRYRSDGSFYPFHQEINDGYDA